MMISFKSYNQSQKYLAKLPKIPLAAEQISFVYTTHQYHYRLIQTIMAAKQRIYLVALYLENDTGGKEVLETLYQAKQNNPQLDIKIFVDWHRAKRSRIGENVAKTNIDFYIETAKKYVDAAFPIYGIPISNREVFGVLHLKGSIIDDTVIYTGASINDVYLQIFDKYRYDRYHFITNQKLANSMISFIDYTVLPAKATQSLLNSSQPHVREIRTPILELRKILTNAHYHIKNESNNQQLAVTPLVGLGRKNELNHVIGALFRSTENKLTLCTPYFNLPVVLVRNIKRLLKQGKQVEIIIGDKTANDFFIPENEPFKLIGGLPYLYEMNLRKFVSHLQSFIDQQLLTIRLWKDDDNSYHLKGIWVDNKWIMITGNNLNPRAWRLDLENAILIHDPKQELVEPANMELEHIRKNSFIVTHYQQIQALQFYPPKIKKLIKRFRRTRLDRILKKLM